MTNYWETPQYREAKKLLDSFQNKFGKQITPAISIAINNAWTDAISKDPDGSQLVPFAKDLIEQFTPMEE